MSLLFGTVKSLEKLMQTYSRSCEVDVVDAKSLIDGYKRQHLEKQA